MRLIERIRRLVADQRRLEMGDGRGGQEAVRREIDRLQARLANVVRRELQQAPAVPSC